MGYLTHLAMYPLIGGSAYFIYSSRSKAAAEQQEKDAWERMPKLKAVDPDNFNPFSAIPFHNNPEMRYRYAETRLHNYIDHTVHRNLNDYNYKYYHDSFDHNNKHAHLYSYVSNLPSDEGAREGFAGHHGHH